MEATSPLTVSSILRALPKGGCRSSFSPSPYGPAVPPFVSTRPSISCYFIVLRLNSGSHRLYRFHVTYARVSSTCKETHIRVRSSRGDTPDNTHIHTQMYPLVRREVCMQIHRVLSIKYSTQGDHVLSPTPRSTRAYLLLPGTYLVWQKENAHLPLPATVSTASTPLPCVDRRFTSGRLSSALITFPSGARGSPLLPPL